jgi:hypothetical protein
VTEITAIEKLEKINIVELFTVTGVGPLVTEIENAARSLVLDPTTAIGRKEIISHAASVARAKTFLDNKGKELTEEWARKKKNVDAGRKEIRDRLDALKDEVRKPVTEYEAAEAARIEAERIEAERIEEEKRAAEAARIAAIEAENERLREQERKRLEAERVAREEQERKAAEERMKAEAAERARLEAERAAAQSIEDAKREAAEAIAREELQKREAEAERIRAEERARIEADNAEKEKQRAIAEERERARREAERIENERIAKIHREQEAEALRVSNAKHRADVLNRATDALMENGIPEDVAADAVALIDAGKIPGIKIVY